MPSPSYHARQISVAVAARLGSKDGRSCIAKIVFCLGLSMVFQLRNTGHRLSADWDRSEGGAWQMADGFFKTIWGRFSLQKHEVSAISNRIWSVYDDLRLRTFWGIVISANTIKRRAELVRSRSKTINNPHADCSGDPECQGRSVRKCKLCGTLTYRPRLCSLCQVETPVLHLRATNERRLRFPGENETMDLHALEDWNTGEMCDG